MNQLHNREVITPMEPKSRANKYKDLLPNQLMFIKKK